MMLTMTIKNEGGKKGIFRHGKFCNGENNLSAKGGIFEHNLHNLQNLQHVYKKTINSPMHPRALLQKKIATHLKID